MTAALAGDRVVAAARAWLGTPFHHQGALRGAGCDCVGLIRGLWADLGLGPVPPAPPYRAAWSAFSPREALIEALSDWLLPCAPEAAGPGAVLVMALRPARPAQHVGILAAPGRLIHAVARRGTVEEAHDRRLPVRAAFAYPEEAPWPR